MQAFFKRDFIIALTLFTVFLAYFSYYVYVDTGKKERYDALFSYLTMEKGYKKADIVKMEASHSIGAHFLSYDPWSISVIFQDEPKAIYYYHYQNGVVSQGGISGYTKNERYNHFENGPLDKRE
ncbi:hypothetical protein CN378_04515 [Bacillus sp. AFS015802]|uniref:hypothetical protein n=1 Tax=Bacillus sp. AFS015802 TaxID=2033486 RepID=UPI000BFA7DB0|nr:hypothetical protein [Bacillus sp. AFS015802]PFA69146.1 hypothetical protein CN378_04515 [Bacillus sp. AFS015802]